MLPQLSATECFTSNTDLDSVASFAILSSGSVMKSLLGVFYYDSSNSCV